MKALISVLVVGSLTFGLMACGSSGSSTSEEASTTSESASSSAKVEALTLEKEKAELEVQKAQTEARQEAREAARQAAKAKAAKAKATKAEAAAQAEPEPEPEPEEVPDVVGMRLPEAKSTLSAAGYSTQAENTDTTFGIVIPSHYTVCTQSEPHGNVVTVLAQKYGC